MAHSSVYAYTKIFYVVSPYSSDCCEWEVEYNEAGRHGDAEADPQLRIPLCVDHPDHLDEGQGDDDGGEPEWEAGLVDNVVDGGGDVLPGDVQPQPGPHPRHVHHAVPGRARVHRHLGEQQGRHQEEEDDREAGHHRHQDGGGRAEESGGEGSLKDEEKESCCAEHGAELEQELVEGAGHVSVGELVIRTQRELEYDEAVIEQVDHKEEANDDVGGGDMSREEADNVDNVAQD